MAWRAGKQAPVGSKVCPICRTTGRAVLYGGEPCAACKATQAWDTAGDKLVIDRASIAAAVQRRAGEQAGEPAWKTLARWLAPAASLALAAASALTLYRLLSPRPIGPLAPLLRGLTVAAITAGVVGAVTVIAAVVAVIRARGRRHFRHLALIASHLIAIAAGGSAAVVGGVHWYSLRAGFGGAYTSMPERRSLDASTQVERIVNATAVVLAPDAEGDARMLAMGTGAVIAADDHRAWIVTCSHVALPYAAVGTFRHARAAQPVWVQLADGREGQATVRWTAPPPLDVALVELAIAHPPDPVTIAADTTGIQADASVVFVPNPYRNGWQVQRGQLVRRERHRTPAGAYDLLYTDLLVIPGDSGSGLFDARGQLIGLNTWTLAGPRGLVEGGGSQGISLPSEAMRVLVDAIHAGALDKLDDAIARFDAPSGKD
ncbi:MAG TPA: serine protease [Kofleriaceae bacterium]|nr:serine protease [Kofleriaceae bacterium]